MMPAALRMRKCSETVDCASPHFVDDVAADAGLLFEQQPHDVDARGMAERLSDGSDFVLVYQSIGRSRQYN